MEEQPDEIERIRAILKEHPKGLTIEDIAKKMPLNRTSTAKYLNTLRISGLAEMRSFGRAKVYTLSRRVPFSQMLNLSSDLLFVLDEDFVSRHVGASAGRHIVLTVRDTGAGMDPETLGRLFEPFFTTKPVGEGTGLGLAMVHGFVVQSGGFIELETRPAQAAGHGTYGPGGTTFRLYFPAVEDVAESARRTPQAPDLPRGSGTVLVVEDEGAIRRVLLETLGECGYTVLTAGDAQEAMALIESAKQKIDLLITDVVMPGWSGPELAKHFQAARPGAAVLMISGHTGKMLTGHGVVPPDVNLLIKPFSSQTLAQTVRKVLGQPKRP